MSKKNNDQPISNVTLKLDAIPNTDNTPIVAYPSSDISTRNIKYLFWAYISNQSTSDNIQHIKTNNSKLKYNLKHRPYYLYGY